MLVTRSPILYARENLRAPHFLIKFVYVRGCAFSSSFVQCCYDIQGLPQLLEREAVNFVSGFCGLFQLLFNILIFLDLLCGVGNSIRLVKKLATLVKRLQC